MKKLFLISAGLLIACFAQAQPVSDNATIPIGVTLNSILRLTVVSGGNIEFVVSSMDDYANGINDGGTISRYQTKFNVASSVNYQVSMYSEDAQINSAEISDLVATPQSIPLNNIGYDLTLGDGSNATTAVPYTYNAPTGTVLPLTNVATTEIVNGPAGDAVSNSFIIRWRLGTVEGTMNAASLLTQSVPAGRYSTNVVLVLAPQ
jgi:hypothetical protein